MLPILFITGICMLVFKAKYVVKETKSFSENQLSFLVLLPLMA